MGIVKANAYGHGLIEISKEMERQGLDYLGVAYVEEGVLLREEGIKMPILVLGGIDNDQIDLYLESNIDIPGSSIEKLENISKHAVKLDKTAKVQLKIDTGMGRIGVQWDRKEEFLEKAYTLPNIEIVGIFSHFANSYTDKEYTDLQIERFNTVLKYIEDNYKLPELIHMANSGAIMHKYENTFFTMVRPGKFLYGYSYDEETDKRLKPVMTFKTKVSYFKYFEKGKSIGYDRTFITNRDTRIVTLPIGYADGYPRSLSNKGEVYLNGNKYPVVGLVCMDQMMVDIGPDGEAYIGDEVELWGDNISLIEISQLSERSAWDLMCNIGERVPRIYPK
jgi:alanine racemase